MNNLLKGSVYEKFTLDHILSKKLYDQAWLWKDTPESVLMKTPIYDKFINYPLYRYDMGADIIAIKDDIIYFIQCKNFDNDNTICMDHLAGIYFLCAEYNLKGIVYYNGKLSSRVINLSNNFLTYINLKYDNIITINNDKIINNNIFTNLIERDYQLDAFNKISNKKRSILSLPCGMGKTFTSYLLSKNYKNIILIAPLRQLTIQLLNDYNTYMNNSYNVILISSDGCRDDELIINNLKDKNIIGLTYKSVDILNKIIDKLDDVFIIIDEYHNLNDKDINSDEKEMNKLLVSDNKILYLSATPLENENKDIFGDDIYKYSWTEGIEKGYINDFEIYIPNTNDKDLKEYNSLVKTLISPLKVDINDNFDDIIKKEEIDKNLYENLIPKCYFCLKGLLFNGDRKCIFYITDTNKAEICKKILENLALVMNLDIEVLMINYKTGKLKRRKILERFNRNEVLTIIINVHILDEGINIPLCDSVFITKPSENIINLIQRMSRCLRKKDKKSHIYLWCRNEKVNKILDYINIQTNNELDKKVYRLEINNKKLIKNYYNKTTNNNYIINSNNSDLFLDNDDILKLVKNNVIYYRALDVAKYLGYSNERKAINNHISNKYKFSYYNLFNDKKYHGQTTFISKKGLYEFILKSEQDKATELKNKIYEIM
jgi:superfamily II DNA or RNA helicase